MIYDLDGSLEAKRNAEVAESTANWRRRFDHPEQNAPLGAEGSKIRAAYEAGRAAERKLLLPIIDRVVGFGEFNVGQLEIKQSNKDRGSYMVFWGNNLQAEGGSLGQAIDYCASDSGRQYHDKVTDLSTFKE